MTLGLVEFVLGLPPHQKEGSPAIMSLISPLMPLGRQLSEAEACGERGCRLKAALACADFHSLHQRVVGSVQRKQIRLLRQPPLQPIERHMEADAYVFCHPIAASLSQRAPGSRHQLNDPRRPDREHSRLQSVDSARRSSSPSASVQRRGSRLAKLSAPFFVSHIISSPSEPLSGRSLSEGAPRLHRLACPSCPFRALRGTRAKDNRLSTHSSVLPTRLPPAGPIFWEVLCGMALPLQTSHRVSRFPVGTMKKLRSSSYRTGVPSLSV